MKTVYYNGKVYRGGGRFAEAFCVENGVFTNVGTSSGVLENAGPEAQKVDLKGDFVCAGFNDSHMHLLNFGQVLSSAALFEHTGSLGDVIGCMKEHLAKHRPAEGEWLTGRGWNQDYFSDVKRMPDRYDLDRISKDIPIMITRACGHCCVINSKALEICGVGKNAVSPEGGSVGSDDGEPDGRLFDNAMELALSRMPVPDKAGLKRMILLASRELNRYGITSVQTDDYCVFRSVSPETVNEAYRELEQEGLLTVRVYEQCNFTEPDELRSFIGKGNVTGKGDAFFRIGPLKLLGDGALGSRTAHLSVPYRDDPDNTGFSLFPEQKLRELIETADENGMQIAVHSIGDACLDRVLDAYEAVMKKYPRRDRRHGIIHCQVTRGDQLERMIKLGLHIYAQTIFLDYDNHIVGKLLDPSLFSSSYAFGTLLKRGLSVSNGSDCPVELPDVMKGLECAVTRCSMDGTGPYRPEEAFTVSEALDSFTAAGAEASFEEKEKGRIEKGFTADFAVLGGDPFTACKSDIHGIPIKSTYIGGNRVF